MQFHLNYRKALESMPPLILSVSSPEKPAFLSKVVLQEIEAFAEQLADRFVLRCFLPYKCISFILHWLASWAGKIIFFKSLFSCLQLGHNLTTAFFCVSLFSHFCAGIIVCSILRCDSSCMQIFSVFQKHFPDMSVRCLILQLGWLKLDVSSSQAAHFVVRSHSIISYATPVLRSSYCLTKVFFFQLITKFHTFSSFLSPVLVVKQVTVIKKNNCTDMIQSWNTWRKLVEDSCFLSFFSWKNYIRRSSVEID